MNDLKGGENTVGGYLSVPGVGGGKVQISSINIGSDFDFGSIGLTAGYENGAGVGVYWNYTQTAVVNLGNIADGLQSILNNMTNMNEDASEEVQKLHKLIMQMFIDNYQIILDQVND